MMKKLLIPMMIIVISIALWEQSKPEKNVFIMVICIFIFMFGMMKLSAKTPSKNNKEEEENV